MSSAGIYSCRSSDDIGFTRYWFAGKAHIDYWKDDELFGHFLYTVVDEQDRLEEQQAKREAEKTEEEKAAAAKREAENKEAADRFRDRPNRLWARVFSPHLPYLWAAILLFAGVFALYKAVVEYTLPFAEPAWDVVHNVLGIGLLLAGVTAAVRIPRLTKHVGWRLSGFVLFVVGILLFPVILTPGAKFPLGSVFLLVKGTNFGNVLIAWLKGVAEHLPAWLNIKGPTFGILAFALAATLLIYFVSWIRPRWGVYPLIIPGAAVVLGVAGVRMFDAGANEKFAEARAVLARSGLKENRLDEASADLIDRYVSDPNASAGCTGTLADCKAFVTFVADKSPGLLGEDAYKDDKRPRESANADGKRENASAAPTGAASASRPLWPVIVAGALFLCLWWLAAHVFDLIVVWQHYIRSSAILDRLNEIRGKSPSSAHDYTARGQG